MSMDVVTVRLTDSAAAHDAVALIAPLGIDTEFQRFEGFDAPNGWAVSILSEERTGQLAAVMTPPNPAALPVLRQTFSRSGPGVAAAAFLPEATPRAVAAAALAEDSRRIAAEAGGGAAGVEAIVADASVRFDYGEPAEGRLYYTVEEVPQVACALGNCIDINTYLIAALRAADYRAAYLTCYYFDDDPDRIPSGMHCWVRTEQDGASQDWDIAHYKKVGRSDVSAGLNPVPGRRFALAYGQDHVYRWRGMAIRVSTPSRPMWVRADGTAIWGEPPEVALEAS